MLFCPECGTLMRPIKLNNKQTILKCPKCGYTINTIEEVKTQYRITEKSKTTYDLIIEEEIQKEVGQSSNIDHMIVCPKCKQKGAYYKDYYDLSSDTGFTLYKCIHCGHTWREE